MVNTSLLRDGGFSSASGRDDVSFWFSEEDSSRLWKLILLNVGYFAPRECHAGVPSAEADFVPFPATRDCRPGLSHIAPSGLAQSLFQPKETTTGRIVFRVCQVGLCPRFAEFRRTLVHGGGVAPRRLHERGARATRCYHLHPFQMGGEVAQKWGFVR